MSNWYCPACGTPNDVASGRCLACGTNSPMAGATQQPVGPYPGPAVAPPPVAPGPPYGGPPGGGGPTSRVVVIAVAATVVAMLAAGGIAYGLIVATRSDDKPQAAVTLPVPSIPLTSSPVTSAPTTAPTTAAATTAPVTSAPVIPPVLPRVATPAVSAESTAASNLQATAQRDAPYVDAYLTGEWVAQLSSKKSGTYDSEDRTTYDLAKIWQKHVELSRYGVYLIRSENFSSFGSGGYWVDVYAGSFSYPAAANSWCDSQGFASSQCFAKFLSHTSSSTGSSVQR